MLNISRLFFLLFFLILSATTYSQTRQSLENQRKQTEKEIEETNRFLRQTIDSKKGSENKLNLLMAQVTQYNRLISGINAELKYIERQINETTSTTVRMNNEIDKMKAEYATLVYQAYKNRGHYNKLIYVLSAKDFNEAYRRMKYFQQYSEFRKKQVVEIMAKQEELKIVIAKLSEQKIEKEKLIADHRLENKKLEVVKHDQENELDKLKAQERQIRDRLAKQQQRQISLDNEIKKLINAEAKKRNTTASNIYDVLTPEEKITSKNFKDNQGKLPWPVDRGVITGFFGKYSHPLVKNIPMNNTGIDITTVVGAEVRTIFDGEVTDITAVLGGNLFIFIRHGNFITVYDNLSEVKVKRGDKVKAKDIIGRVYAEKGAESSVLHFKILEETNPLNPELWLVKR